MSKEEIRPRLSREEYEVVKKYRGIKNASNTANVDVRDVKHGWLKSKDASIFFTNPEHSQPILDVDTIDWEKITKEIFSEVNHTVVDNSLKKGLFDRLVYTDVHIGMKISETAQYDFKWNKEELLKSLDKMIKFVVKQQQADILIIDDLGDFMDGWDSMTVRRQHKLPQNMTNNEAFDVGVMFKLKLVNELSKHYKKIICHNLTQDNHAGSFGYVVNSAFKAVAKQMFDNVEIINYRKFINHYTIKDNTFIVCHGKDSENLKYGLKPKLDAKALGQINNYIDMNFLAKKDMQIEFSKGDSHIELIDKQLPTRFTYWCYPAFSPASSWVQANFVPKDYGFYFFNYESSKRYSILPYYF